MREQEVERSARLLATLDPTQRDALDAMSRALVKKVLHQPLQVLREAAREGDLERVQTILKAMGEEEL